MPGEALNVVAATVLRARIVCRMDSVEDEEEPNQRGGCQESQAQDAASDEWFGQDGEEVEAWWRSNLRVPDIEVAVTVLLGLTDVKDLILGNTQ